ncbi:hypothetical protein BDZ97DRAFT_1912155 [Flammula alnicola]|nr:hypothetical protein BDZ97DRAFT_1912155 [Flammula alnicola]
MFKAAISSFATRTAVCAPTQLGGRAFHTSPTAHKTVTEKVSEVADKVNKSVGKGLASAIDKGEKATHATKDTLGSTTEEMKQKGNQATAGAREAKEDFQKETRK